MPAYSLEAVAGISGAALVTQVKAAEKLQIPAFSRIREVLEMCAIPGLIPMLILFKEVVRAN